MARDVFPAGIAKFADFEVDLSSGNVRKADLEIRIQAKPLEVLRLLLATPGRVVRREELRLALWPDNTFVDFEHGLNTAVKKLRKALEDSAEYPKFVETIPKAGYRFIGAVEWISDSAHGRIIDTRILSAVPDAGIVQQPIYPKPRIGWRGIALSGALAVIAALIILRQYLWLPQKQVLKGAEGWAAR